MRRAALSMFVAALLAAGAAAAGAGGACSAPANAPANDCFANAGVLSSAESGSATGTNVGGSKEPGEPDHAGNPGGASIWYAWTAPASFDVAFTTAGSAFDTLLAAYTGSTVDALQLVAANDDAGGLQSRVEFAAAAGTTYMVAVDGYGGATGSVTLAWERLPDAPPPPPNDDFAAAHVLPSAETGSVTGTNVDATKEAGEPNHAGNRGGASVWYAWTAPAAVGVRFSTEGSSFDTVLAVYTGAAVDALAPVAANDDEIGLQSSVQFEAAAGVTYAIAVDGFGGATGSITLSWDPVDAQPPSAPPNDSFANAVEIGGAAGQVDGTTLDGTAELGEPDHAGQPAQRSVWYRWTSPSLDWEEGPTVSPDRFQGAGERWPGHWRTPPDPWPEEALLTAETHERVMAAIAVLPPRQRAVISLRDVHGWGPSEVCAVLDLTEGNQRVLLHRARAAVRAALARALTAQDIS